MGVLDNTTITVDAILTKKGRELLAQGEGKFKITQFALADDEIDYGLWNDESLDGQIIDNQPVFEPNVNWRTPTDSEIMKYFIFKNKVLENG